MSKEEAIKLLFVNTSICAQILMSKIWQNNRKTLLEPLKIGISRVKCQSGIKIMGYNVLEITFCDFKR